jgi:hypothetical protein
MTTLKDRTLNPAVGRFMACAHDVAKAMQAPARKSAWALSGRHRCYEFVVRSG